MKNIYLVRHCAAAGQESTSILTNEGKQQALDLAEFLMDIDIELVVTSPYLRAIDTIKPFCEKLILKIETDERLKERILSTKDYVDWMDKLKETYTDLDLKFEGGESSIEAMNRGIEVIEEMKKRAEFNIVLVTHGALMSLVLKHFEDSFGFDDWKKISNPDIYHLLIDTNETIVRRIWK
ncbi:MAG: histidine phosphatase family protein [Paenibacillus sp.]|jgi:2,3-bisphosphoglycerate-dependent phosphoglycerate mutase|nr:histidine phosphatase family protein [Paenibacillus sp.]